MRRRRLHHAVQVRADVREPVAARRPHLAAVHVAVADQAVQGARRAVVHERGDAVDGDHGRQVAVRHPRRPHALLVRQQARLGERGRRREHGGGQGPIDGRPHALLVRQQARLGERGRRREHGGGQGPIDVRRGAGGRWSGRVTGENIRTIHGRCYGRVSGGETGVPRARMREGSGIAGPPRPRTTAVARHDREAPVPAASLAPIDATAALPRLAGSAGGEGALPLAPISPRAALPRGLRASVAARSRRSCAGRHGLRHIVPASAAADLTAARRRRRERPRRHARCQLDQTRCLVRASPALVGRALSARGAPGGPP